MAGTPQAREGEAITTQATDAMGRKKRHQGWHMTGSAKDAVSASLPTDVKVLRVQLRHARQDAEKAGALADAVTTENERLRWALDQVRIRLAMHLEDFPANRLYAGSRVLQGTWELACDALEGRPLDRHM
jgi:hypothetical protein